MKAKGEITFTGSELLQSADTTIPSKLILYH